MIFGLSIGLDVLLLILPITLLFLNRAQRRRFNALKELGEQMSANYEQYRVALQTKFDYQEKKINGLLQQVQTLQQEKRDQDDAWTQRERVLQVLQEEYETTIDITVVQDKEIQRLEGINKDLLQQKDDLTSSLKIAADRSIEFEKALQLLNHTNDPHAFPM
jgi:hypothetical protein